MKKKTGPYGLVLCYANHKGGVGKTTFAHNTAKILLDKPDIENVLMIDMDAQANLSKRIIPRGVNMPIKIEDILRYAVEKQVNFVAPSHDLDIINDMIKRATFETVYKRKSFCVITSSLKLQPTKIALAAYDKILPFKIPELIKYIAKDYDLTVIDTGPDVELLPLVSVIASDYLIIPITADDASHDGATNVINEILYYAHHYYRSKVELIGVIWNEAEKRTVLNETGRWVAEEKFGDLLFSTDITRSVKLKQLGNIQATIDQTGNSLSQRELRALTDEIYERMMVRFTNREHEKVI